LVAVGQPEAILDFAVACQHRVVFGLAQGRVAEPRFEIVHLVLEIEQRLEREAGLGDDRPAGMRQAILREVAER
jgi:hypothetical protein